MCQRITCPDCNKPSFTGCGRHVEQVLGDVRPEDRCTCRETGAGADKAGSKGLGRSLFARLFGKS
jgi:hypothetical protein